MAGYPPSALELLATVEAYGRAELARTGQTAGAWPSEAQARRQVREQQGSWCQLFREESRRHFFTPTWSIEDTFALFLSFFQCSALRAVG